MSKPGTLLGTTRTHREALDKITAIKNKAGVPPSPSVFFFVDEIEDDIHDYGISWADKDIDNHCVVEYISRVEDLCSTTVK